MQIFQGIAASPGVAIGEALVIDNEGFRIPRRFVVRDAADEELSRLQRGFQTVAAQIARDRDTITGQLGAKYGAIFSAHLEMLEDPQLLAELEALIRQRHYSAEYAVSRTLRRYAKVFEKLEGGFQAERAHDIFDLEKNLLHSLLGESREELSRLTSPVVVLAHNLTPGETARLDRQHVLGFVTEVGGSGGHTAIVAKGLELPAVVGTGRFLTDVSGGDRVIVDGDQGKLILRPDKATLARYQQEEQDHKSLRDRLQELRDLPAETADGVPIQLLANIEFPYEAALGSERGAGGVGLYRTEFLYLARNDEPSEEDHFQAYAEVARVMGERPVVIRTLDLGADKMGQLPRGDEELNPFLGLRSIRLALRNLDSFRIQLRAILRASVHGAIRILFPMITTLSELRQAKMVLADVREDLDDEGIAYSDSIPVGMMVEVPAAVIKIDQFLPEVDFLSLGTNDLIQYTLAVDRGNKDVADLYQACDPAVLRLIASAQRTAAAAGIPFNVCGQMSSNAAQAMLLIGMGFRSLSVPPRLVPEIKKLCRSILVADAERIADAVMEMESAREIEHFLRAELQRLVPELAPHALAQEMKS